MGKFAVCELAGTLTSSIGAASLRNTNCPYYAGKWILSESKFNEITLAAWLCHTNIIFARVAYRASSAVFER